MANVPFKSNVGLPSSTTAPASDEADIYYRSDEGRVRVDVGTNTGIVGPYGGHPLNVFGTANCWYALQPGGGAHTSAAVTDNRPYTYPLWPGRKTTLTGIRTRITVAVVSGGVRAVLWAADPATGLPGALMTDYGTQSALVAGTIAWTISEALEPVPYWLSIIPQTGLALSMSRYTTFNPQIPWIAAAPTIGAGDWWNCLYGAGIAGAPPATFGAIVAPDLGPHVMIRLT